MKYLIDLAFKKCWQKVGCVVKNSQNGFGICCSVIQSCPTLCNPWTAAHQVFLSNSCPLSWWCHPTISFSVALFSFCPQSFPASESFPVSRLFASGGQSIGASASASILAVEIQGWLPLGLTSLISLLSKELLSKSFPAPQFEGINSLALSLFHCPALTPMHDYWKNHSFN